MRIKIGGVVIALMVLCSVASAENFSGSLIISGSDVATREGAEFSQAFYLDGNVTNVTVVFTGSPAYTPVRTFTLNYTDSDNLESVSNLGNADVTFDYINISSKLHRFVMESYSSHVTYDNLQNTSIYNLPDFTFSNVSFNDSTLDTVYKYVIYMNPTPGGAGKNLEVSLTCNATPILSLISGLDFVDNNGVMPFSYYFSESVVDPQTCDFGLQCQNCSAGDYIQVSRNATVGQPHQLIYAYFPLVNPKFYNLANVSDYVQHNVSYVQNSDYVTFYSNGSYYSKITYSDLRYNVSTGSYSMIPSVLSGFNSFYLTGDDTGVDNGTVVVKFTESHTTENPQLRINSGVWSVVDVGDLADDEDSSEYSVYTDDVNDVGDNNLTLKTSYGDVSYLFTAAYHDDVSYSISYADHFGYQNANYTPSNDTYNAFMNFYFRSSDDNLSFVNASVDGTLLNSSGVGQYYELVDAYTVRVHLANLTAAVPVEDIEVYMFYNNFPDIVRSYVTPYNPLASNNLTCNSAGDSDADSDALDYAYAWFEDGVWIDSSNWSVLGSPNTTATHYYKCNLTVSDGYNVDYYLSDQVYVDYPAACDDGTLKGFCQVNESGSNTGNWCNSLAELVYYPQWCNLSYSTTSTTSTTSTIITSCDGVAVGLCYNNTHWCRSNSTDSFLEYYPGWCSSYLVGDGSSAVQCSGLCYCEDGTTAWPGCFDGVNNVTYPACSNLTGTENWTCAYANDYINSGYCYLRPDCRRCNYACNSSQICNSFTGECNDQGTYAFNYDAGNVSISGDNYNFLGIQVPPLIMSIFALCVGGVVVLMGVTWAFRRL